MGINAATSGSKLAAKVEEYFDASRQLDVTVDLEREVYPADRDYGFRRQPVAVLQPAGRHRLVHGLSRQCSIGFGP